MRRVFVLVVAASLAAPSAAFGAIRITKVQYDSPGTDYGSNSSLNAEWVRIKNTGPKKKSLDGWKLRDKAGHVYRFNDFRLGAGKWVKVHSGSGAHTKYHLYQDSGAYIWNNDGDTAKLKKGKKVIDECSWAGGESPNPPAYC
jgi:hypothetical protein